MIEEEYSEDYVVLNEFNRSAVERSRLHWVLQAIRGIPDNRPSLDALEVQQDWIRATNGFLIYAVRNDGLVDDPGIYSVYEHFGATGEDWEIVLDPIAEVGSKCYPNLDGAIPDKAGRAALNTRGSCKWSVAAVVVKAMNDAYALDIERVSEIFSYRDVEPELDWIGIHTAYVNPGCPGGNDSAVLFEADDRFAVLMPKALGEDFACTIAKIRSMHPKPKPKSKSKWRRLVDRLRTR